MPQICQTFTTYVWPQKYTVYRIPLRQLKSRAARILPFPLQMNRKFYLEVTMNEFLLHCAMCSWEDMHLVDMINCILRRRQYALSTFSKVTPRVYIWRMKNKKTHKSTLDGVGQCGHDKICQSDALLWYAHEYPAFTTKKIWDTSAWHIKGPSTSCGTQHHPSVLKCNEDCWIQFIISTGSVRSVKTGQFHGNGWKIKFNDLGDCNEFPWGKFVTSWVYSFVITFTLANRFHMATVVSCEFRLRHLRYFSNTKGTSPVRLSPLCLRAHPCSFPTKCKQSQSGIRVPSNYMTFPGLKNSWPPCKAPSFKLPKEDGAKDLSAPE